MEASTSLKRTPLFRVHQLHNAKIVPFAGWEMPIQYTGILEETKAVRNHAGLFDVSHMGRVIIEGRDAASFLNRIYSTDPASYKTGKAKYGFICNEQGGIIDDCILYRLAENRFLLIPNAGNAARVIEWLHHWLEPAKNVRIQVVSAEMAMIAIQGPEAQRLLQTITEAPLGTMKPFSLLEGPVQGIKTSIARTGYTGEDGFEMIMPRDPAGGIWLTLTEKGATPCGLGARDVLRLEAGLPLHGNDIDITTNPYEAGLGRFLDPDRDAYIAGKALKRIRDSDVTRNLVGFNMVGRGIARHGFPILAGEKEIGHVTSGGYSPTLDRNIGMGYVPVSYSKPGARFLIDIRGRTVEAEVTSLPFYVRRSKQ